jgi:Uma2 family endonuclease
MEATAQATQRKITLESLDLVHADRPDVHVCNELLVQYPKGPHRDDIGQIVPDNMVVISEKPPAADTSYDLPIVRVRPFWVLEYVSKHNHRKDYEISLAKYEQELKVPYYLVSYPEAQEMTLFKLAKSRYGSVRANRNERFPVRELEMEVALLDGWVRYWYKGELLALPADLQRDLHATRRQLKQEQKARAAAEAEVARLRAELARLRKNHK